MTADISITYSPFWIMAVLMAGLVYALLLYYKNPLSKLSAKVNILLFILRFLSVSSLAFLLLSPSLNKKSKIFEKPIVVLGIDNSRSMVLTADSNTVRQELPLKTQKLLKQLQEKYQADFYLFGESIKSKGKINFQDNFSDYAQFLRFVKNDYKGLNVGAVVLAGDGIFNRGISPEYEAASFPWPVYTIAYGDTNTYADLKVNHVRFNDIVYLNDEFPVEIHVTAQKLKGKTAGIKVKAFGKPVYEQKFLINSNHFEKTFRTVIPAKEKGKHRVTISLTTFKNEQAKQNNRKNIYVDVLDSEKKILIVAAAPHPDISAIRSSLEHYKNYKIDLVYENKLNRSPDDYNLIILHQYPTRKTQSTLFWQKLQQSNVPVLFILGKKTSLDKLQQISGGFEIKTPHGFENAQAVVNPLFSLFTYTAGHISTLEKLPPLTVPFGNYIMPSFAHVFAYQKINNISTDLPLILFYSKDKKKYGIITGEGLWLWKMHDYLLQRNFQAIESLLGKTVQYLLAREDKRHFRISCGETFYPGEKIEITARLYNDTWEMVNDPEINLTLIDEKGQHFKYVFNRYENYYSLTINDLKPGIYRYQAGVKLGDKNYSDKGEFVIHSISLESRHLKANHQILYTLSEETGGTMVYPDGMDNLPSVFQKQNKLKTKVLYEYRIEGFNNLLWFMLGIILLLSTEWFLRKYFGSY